MSEKPDTLPAPEGSPATGEAEPEGDAVAMIYLAQQLYLDSCQETPNSVRIGVRWGCMDAGLQARWLNEARAKVQAWCDDENSATASRKAEAARLANVNEYLKGRPRKPKRQNREPT